MIVRWQVDDGYAGPARPKLTEICDEELREILEEEGEEAVEQYIEECVQQDFEERVSWFELGRGDDS